MTCKRCEHYSHGDGTRACIKCKRYKYLFPRSRSVNEIEAPNILLESIPDSRYKSLVTILRSVPLEDATLILQHYLLRADFKELAEYHNEAEHRVRYRFKRTLLEIRKNGGKV